MKWLLILPVLIFLVGVYGVLKPLPEGLNMKGEERTVAKDSLVFLEDVTYTDAEGTVTHEQEIFDEMLRMIEDAHSYVLLDFFFYSDFLGTETDSYRKLSAELTDALILKKQSQPEITIQVITDPINTFYGGYAPPDFKRLQDAGITVVVTNLEPLRDSNPAYSAFWRTGIQWFGTSDQGGWLTNLLDVRKPDVPLRSYLASLNFKANHRKVMLADWKRGEEVGISTLITSANPHDGSSENSNIAVRADSGIWRDVLVSEKAVADLSGFSLLEPSSELTDRITDRNGEVSVQLLTEQAIEKEAVTLLDSLSEGDQFDMAMFYISDRDIVSALKRADERGVKIRIVLDPNKDAFGREKNGIPNRQVAHELMSHTHGNTSLRWCDTQGEQCHSKMLLATKEGISTLIQGSANLTRRNLENLNLETDLKIKGSKDVPVLKDAQVFFERMWGNDGGNTYTVVYETYEDTDVLKTIRYRMMEFTGMSRF